MIWRISEPLLAEQIMAERRYLDRCHHRVGWLGILLLMLPILAWVGLAASEPLISVVNGAVPRYVISGQLFAGRFDTRHAGCAIHRPTIGMWLFWFTFMAVTSLPYTAAVGWVADRRRKAGYAAYSLSVTLLCVFLLCMLTWPLIWLIEYIWSMGITQRRICGLVYTIAGVIIIIVVLLMALTKPKARHAAPS